MRKSPEWKSGIFLFLKTREKERRKIENNSVSPDLFREEETPPQQSFRGEYATVSEFPGNYLYINRRIAGFQTAESPKVE